MIYGIEQTTDSRYPETVVRKFTSEPAARSWRDGAPAGPAWPGAANPDLPITQQNFHERFRTLYCMPKGWRAPTQKVLNRQAAERRRPAVDCLSVHVRRDGEEID